MKPLFGIDITNNKKNDVSNIQSFICKSNSQSTIDAIDKVSNQAVNIAEKASLPIILKIVYWVSALGLIIAIRVLLDLLLEEEIPFSQIVERGPWLLPVLVVCGALFGGILYYKKRKEKNVLESDEYAVNQNRIDVVLENAYNELGVPLDIEDVDVFSGCYKEKNGKYVFKEVGISPFKYVNFSFRIFIQDGDLYIADVESMYCLKDFKALSIEKVDKNISFPVWNKDTPHNEGEFKQYKISYNNEIYSCKPYYILYMEASGEKWSIYFPSYELPFFEKLTGFKAE